MSFSPFSCAGCELKKVCVLTGAESRGGIEYLREFAAKEDLEVCDVTIAPAGVTVRLRGPISVYRGAGKDFETAFRRAVGVFVSMNCVAIARFHGWIATERSVS
jgi:hypothetical protein